MSLTLAERKVAAEAARRWRWKSKYWVGGPGVKADYAPEEIAGLYREKPEVVITYG